MEDKNKMPPVELGLREAPQWEKDGFASIEEEYSWDSEGFIGGVDKIPFSLFPTAIKKGITSNILMAVSFTFLGLFVLYNTFYIPFLVFLVIILAYFVYSAYGYYTIGSTEYYTLFEGSITIIDASSLNAFKKNKSYVVQVTDFVHEKTIAFDYEGTKTLKEGMPVVLYLAKGTAVSSDSDFGPFVENYLGVSFYLQNEAERGLFKKNETVDIDDYMFNKPNDE